MPNPQQPELRRSDKGPATDQDQRRAAVEMAGSDKAQGSDKGASGGGEGGGVPPDQQTTDERVAGD